MENDMDIFIVNKEAGNGKSIKYLKALEEIYDSSFYPYKTIYAKNREDTLNKALYYSTLNNVRYIFSIGGDGTLNSIINGMIGKKPLVVIPAGTGNDFYKGTSNLNNDTLVDVGKVNNEYFLGILSIGLDALACNKANIIKRKDFNKNAYIKGTLQALKEYESLLLKMTYDDKELSKSVLLSSFCNNSCLGNGINLSPNSSLTDGKLDLILINDMNKLRILYTFIKILMGRHLNDKNVSFEKIDKAHLEFLRPVLYAFDGEERYASELDIKVSSKKILIKKELDPRIIKVCNEK